MTTKGRSFSNYIPLILILFICIPVKKLPAADWPVWRFDAKHSAASPEGISEELHLLWSRQYTPRVMTWDDPLNQDIMPYDRVFEPVVKDDLLYVGFNDTDKLAALDTETGEARWTFYTDGPVRLPPVASGDRLYAVSDDGCLYCLDAVYGELIWKFRGGPSNKKLLGNRRLISAWPARGAPVIEDGVVYWSASIWPFMGVFIYALDAETGAVIWINDENGSRYMLQPHNAPSFAGVAPQGCFTVSGGRLLVPGGRSVPACFDRATGAFSYYNLASSGKTGGSFVCATDDLFFNHYREGITTLYDIETGSALYPRAGRYPVALNDMVYFSGKSISAYSTGWIREDLKRWKKNGGDVRKLFMEKFDANKLWNLPVDASGDLIRAGDCLYAGGDRRITAVSVPEKEKPEILWTKNVDGSVERLLAADDKLFAVTLDGRIMAFGREKKNPNLVLGRPVDSVLPKEAVAEALACIEETGIREGYALFYGTGDGSLLEALAVNSDLHITAVEPDSEKARKMRVHLDSAGLYGEKIAVIPGSPAPELPPYFASLTVINNTADSELYSDGAFLKKIYHSMRPYDGTVYFTGPVDSDKIAQAVNRLKLPGIAVKNRGKTISLVRKGPLDGAASWTHTYGSMANTAKSEDRLVKLPLGLLWFGGNSNLDVLPRHGHGPPEQVMGGRLFIEGTDCLSARDVYTGRVLWKKMFTDLGTFGEYYNETYKPHLATNTAYNQVHLPGVNIRGTNYIVTPEHVYVIHGRNSCLLLDPVTGTHTGTFSLPPLDAKGKDRPEWAYIGIYEDKLIAGYDFVAFSGMEGSSGSKNSMWENFDKSASRGLVIMDRFSGKVLWHAFANHGFLHNGITAGEGKLFVIDKLPSLVRMKLERRGLAAAAGNSLEALDIETGAVLWNLPEESVFGSFLSYSEDHNVIVQSTRPSRDMVRGEDGVRMNIIQAVDGAVLWDRPVEYSTFPILHGNKFVTEDGVFSLKDGDLLTRTDPLTGEEIPWTWKRYYGCNSPIASENLLLFRSGAAGYYDFSGGGGTGNFGGFKSGCTSNLVAADGVLNAPDYTRTCNCAYQNQTSLALIHMPEVETWTFNPFEWSGKPVKRTGINFGAPGDYADGEGTLWLDYPSVGGDSPDLPVEIGDGNVEYYRYHSSRYEESPYARVAASGVKGVKNLKIIIDKTDSGKKQYAVRLIFSEPDRLPAGGRTFDVYLQGRKVLGDFNIMREAGSNKKTIVKEFTGVEAEQAVDIRFEPADVNRSSIPVISGVELIAE